MDISNYRDILRQEFLKRSENSPEYTLKQFSKDCGLPANRMSDILNQRYGISKQNGEKISENLRLDAETTEIFLISIEALHARNKTIRDSANEKLKRLIFKPDRVYSKEELECFLNWYDLAIVELMRHPKFNNSLSWLAMKLDKPVSEIEENINRMINVGAISNFNGNYLVNYQFFSTSSQISSKTIKKYHKQILDISKDSVEKIDVSERDFSSISFLCEPKDMDEIKNKIKNFVQGLVSDFETSSDNSDLYVLNAQFFSPTKKN